MRTSKLNTFFEVILEVNHYYGLVPWYTIKDHERLEDFLQLIHQMGIHGKNRAHNPMQMRVATVKTLGHSKRPLWLILLFPSPQSLNATHRQGQIRLFVYSSRLVSRWFRLFVLNQKSTLLKIRFLLKSHKYENKTKYILKTCGIIEL
jgi:hypothetical protein